MASYAIINTTEQENGKIIYDVILKADDGYEELQRYACEAGDASQDVLVNAANHFNQERIKMKEKTEDTVEEVIFIDIPTVPNAVV